MTQKSSPYNPYVKKVGQYQGLCFANEEANAQRGKWLQMAHARMGAQPKKLTLEIGCSNGSFLNRIASQNKEQCFIGLDWKYKLVCKGAEKSIKQTINNTLFIRHDSEHIKQMFAPEELDEVWIFFPDPWPKASQQKNRLIQDLFLLDLAQIVKPNGHCYIKTDHPGYFQWILDIFGVPELGPSIDFSPARPSSEPSDGHSSKSEKVKRDSLRFYENVQRPKVNPQVKSVWNISNSSCHFWETKSKNAAIKAVQPVFWEEKTLFEELFVKDNLPVYYLALERTLKS